MSAVVVHNLDALVTKDCLDHVLDARFAQQDALLDQLEGRMNELFSDMESRMGIRGEFGDSLLNSPRNY